MPISPKEREILDRLLTADKRQGVYRSLHGVGDDFTKANVEEMLRELLPEGSYKLVEASSSSTPTTPFSKN